MLGNKFLKGAGFVVAGTVLTSMVQYKIGFADSVNLDGKSSDLVNKNSLQKIVSDGAKDECPESKILKSLQEKELSEVLDMITVNRQQHDDIEKEKKELKKMYEEKMGIINEKSKKNNKN